jgi:hypothetical protein
MDRKRERLLSQEERDKRHEKHPVSTEPATSEKGLPEIPPRKTEERKGGNQK